MGVLLSGLLGRYAGRPDADIPPPPEWLALVLHGITRTHVARFLAAHSVTARITSGYRDPARNERVGGAANSAHMHGLGVDLVVTGGASARAVADWWRADTGGVAIVESDHVHLNLPRAWGWSVVRALVAGLFLSGVLVFLLLTGVANGKAGKTGARR